MEAKQRRRDALVLAALQMFEETSYEAVTMAGVADRAGLAKGTVYLYFETKEDLFLSVLELLLRDWFDDLDAWLAAGDEPCNAGELADFITSLVLRRSAFPRLLSILHTTLEHNITAQRARAFKLFLADRIDRRTAGLLERRLPFLRESSATQLLTNLYALVIGLWHQSDPAPAVQETLTVPGMERFVVDFGTQFARAVRALLAGDQELARPDVSCGLRDRSMPRD